jgi:hypothetical protein
MIRTVRRAVAALLLTGVLVPQLVLGQGADGIAISAKNTAVVAQTQAKAAIRSNRTGGLSIIDRTNAPMAAGTATIATAGTIAQTVRVAHANLTGRAVSSVMFAYAHYAPAGSTEAATNYQLQIKAAIETSGTTSDQTTYTPRKMNFNGVRLVTMDKYTVTYTNETAVNIASAAPFWERTGITSPTSGATYGRSANLRGCSTAPGISDGSGSASTDVVDFGTVSLTCASGYSASLVLGRTADGTIAPSITFTGDSICGTGTDDEQYGVNNGGWPLRAFAAYPGGNLCIAGEKLSDVVSGNNFNARDDVSRWSTHILNEYLRNDIGNGQSVATMKANVLAFAYHFMSRGQTFVQATAMPAPTSTDGWFTVTNQNKETYDANRVAMNQWIRDTSAAGFVAQAKAQVASIAGAGGATFVDPAAGYECNSAGVLTQDGGYILGSQSGLLATGTATGVTTTTLTDTSKSWTVNGYAGIAVYISSGTGAGQMRVVQSNTATVLTVGIAWSPALDTTSVYQVFDAVGLVSGVHPTSTGHRKAAAAVNAAAVMSLAGS